MEGWQSGWDGSDMERYAYSTWPVVMPWFKPQESSGTDRYHGKSHRI
jgi:hypothetical protein